MLEMIREAWRWTGLEPAEVVASNAFGNLIVRAADGCFWRICPEELSCEVIARDSQEFEALSKDNEFRADWEMTRLVKLAKRKVGPVSEGRCYCLKVPAALGGEYEAANLGTISQKELIAFAGDLAEKIKDLPDGAQIELGWE